MLAENVGDVGDPCGQILSRWALQVTLLQHTQPHFCVHPVQSVFIPKIDYTTKTFNKLGNRVHISGTGPVLACGPSCYPRSLLFTPWH
jgi:hypothetical protein